MALPKFSFSGWNSQSIAPKVPVLPPGVTAFEGTGGLMGNTLKPLGATKGIIDNGVVDGKTLVGTTNAANPDLPAWLQAEVDRLNAQEALRKAALGGGGGSAPAPTQNIGDILQGVAAVTAARGQFNTSLNQINEQARLQSLIQQRSQLRPTGGFGFNDPLQVPRMLDLDRQISGYQNVNLPLAAGAVGGFRPSGWVNPFRTF